MDILHRYTGAVLYHSDLFNVHDALIAAVSSRADLSRADLSRADLSGADLSGADLYGADLSRANLSRADLSGADLSGADLSGANLYGADLSRANLYGANLSRADLSRADLSGANLYGADLSRASGINPLLTDDLRMLHDQGEITAYKLVDANLRSPMGFGVLTYSIGAELTEEDASIDETVQCAHGLSVGTLAWCMRNWKPGWRILRVLHLGCDIAAIPIGTDGKWRVTKLRVIGELPMSEWGEGPWSEAKEVAK